jgi:competence protein ComGC
MLSARCKICNVELYSSSKSQCCGCENQMSIIDDKISANDLSEVVLTNSEKNLKKGGMLSNADLEYQENRRKRKVRKLDFETR